MKPATLLALMLMFTNFITFLFLFLVYLYFPTDDQIIDIIILAFAGTIVVTLTTIFLSYMRHRAGAF